jgi:hypothetical protein
MYEVAYELYDENEEVSQLRHEQQLFLRNRFLGMKGSDYWAEHAGQVRLVKCQRESELQGIAVEPWHFLYWSDELQGLKMFRPLDAELSVGDRDRSPYGVVRPVPSCTLWNFLDNELEIDVPLMNVEEWSDFVRGRSCADQKRMTLVMTRVLVQARMMDRTCQVKIALGERKGRGHGPYL